MYHVLIHGQKHDLFIVSTMNNSLEKAWFLKPNAPAVRRQKHDRREIVAERQAFLQESVFFLDEVGVASHLRQHGLEELVCTLLQDDLANVDCWLELFQLSTRFPVGCCALVGKEVVEVHIELRIVLRTGELAARVPVNMRTVVGMVAYAPLAVGAWFELNGRFFYLHFRVSFLIGLEGF